MKKVWNLKSIVATVLFATFTTIAAPVALANDSSHVNPVELKFLGQNKDHLIFQLNFDDAVKDNDYTVIIIDKAGNTLYRDNIKGEKISKRFLINSDDIDENQLKFQITDKKSNETVVYQINHTTRVIQDVAVNKIK